jgi:hypothetical protein
MGVAALRPLDGAHGDPRGYRELLSTEASRLPKCLQGLRVNRRLFVYKIVHKSDGTDGSR